MLDINYILNGKKTKPKKDSLMNLMVSPKRTIIGDRITNQQRRVPRNQLFNDFDKDGVINGLDCQPRNPRRHMAWDIEQAKKEAQRPYFRLTEVSSDKLDIQREPSWRKQDDEIFWDLEKHEYRPMNELAEKIKSPSEKVEVVILRPENEKGMHTFVNGRHRVMANIDINKEKEMPALIYDPEHLKYNKPVNEQKVDFKNSYKFFNAEKKPIRKYINTKIEAELENSNETN